MQNGKLHILHCIYSMLVGGAETLLVDIANTQVKNGDRVTLLIVNDKINELLLGTLDSRVEVIRMGRKQSDKPLLMMMRLNMIIARLRPDVIHAHHHKFCRLVLVRKNRLLFTVHEIGTPMHFAAHSRMSAITDAVKQDVISRVPGADITTVLNGIITDSIDRRTPHTPKDKFRIVQVARLMTGIKGQDILIRALGTLHRQGIDNIEVSFIGDGPDREMLERLAIEEGVETRIHFMGLKDRRFIYSHLSSFDAMCHPSRSEGFGLIIAEAMAAGLPLVVTQGDGPWEVADRGRLCLSFRNGDAADCARAIRQLMADYPAAQAKADEAIGYVRKYDIARTVENYDRYYRSFIR